MDGRLAHHRRALRPAGSASPASAAAALVALNRDLIAPQGVLGALEDLQRLMLRREDMTDRSYELTPMTQLVGLLDLGDDGGAPLGLDQAFQAEGWDLS